MDSIVNKRNRVPELQRLYQSDTRPVYQRLPRARLYMGILLGLSAVGTYGVVGGLYNALHGKKIELN